MRTKIVVIVSFIFLNIPLLNGQTLNKEVRNDFCKNAIVNAYFAKGFLKNWMIISAQKLGYKTPLEIEKAIQNLCSNIELQNEFLKTVNSLGGDRKYKEQQFLSIGMTSQNSKLLVDYLLLKYSSNQIDTNNDFDYNFVTDTIVIDKKTFLQSFFPTSTFIDENSVLRKEKSINMDGENSVIDLKTSVIKEYSYYDDKEDEERLKIVLFSTNDKGISYLDIVTMNGIEDGRYKPVGSPKKIIIEQSKQKDIIFKTVGNQFVIQYLNDNIQSKGEYYNIVDFDYVKTVVENENNSNSTDKSKKDNEPALVKDIFQKNGKTYISLKIVQIEYDDSNDYKIINENPKIGIYEVPENINLKDNICRTIKINDYLLKNKEKIVSKDKNDIRIFSSENGILTDINLGCWN